MQNQSPDSAMFPIRNIRLNLLLGVIICVWTLNGVLHTLATRLPHEIISKPVEVVAQLPQAVYDHIPVGEGFLFSLILRWLIVALGVMLGLLLILSLKEFCINPFVAGSLGLAFGLVIFTIMSVTVWLVVMLCYVAFVILTWIKAIFSSLFTWMFSAPAVYCLTVLLLIGLGWALVYGRSYLWAWWYTLVKSFGRVFPKVVVIIVGGVLALGVLVVLSRLIPPLWYGTVSPLLDAFAQWWSRNIAPILSTIGRALLIIIAYVLGMTDLPQL